MKSAGLLTGGIHTGQCSFDKGKVLTSPGEDRHIDIETYLKLPLNANTGGGQGVLYHHSGRTETRKRTSGSSIVIADDDRDKQIILCRPRCGQDDRKSR